MKTYRTLYTLLMQRITGDEFKTILPFFKSAASEAAKATCKKGHCGSVIVKDGEIIGRGFAHPPKNQESNRTCLNDDAYDYTRKPRFDKTCCVHAEWAAILDAAKHAGDKINGARLYFIRLDENGDFTGGGRPYCTVCSRLSMESGIAEFALYHDGGANIYESGEYDRISYDYHKK